MLCVLYIPIISKNKHRVNKRLIHGKVHCVKRFGNWSVFELREQKTAGERKRTGDGKRMVGKMEMEEGEGKVKEQEREWWEMEDI